jgi:hypothetical protein
MQFKFVGQQLILCVLFGLVVSSYQYHQYHWSANQLDNKSGFCSWTVPTSSSPHLLTYFTGYPTLGTFLPWCARSYSFRGTLSGSSWQCLVTWGHSVVTIVMFRIVKLLPSPLSSPWGHGNVLAVHIACGRIRERESLWTIVPELLFSVFTKACGSRELPVSGG